MTFLLWWQDLAAPLTRLLLGLCGGLLVANLIEALGLARGLGRLGRPLASLARLGPISGAAFALAFVSPSAANALLAEHHDAGRLSGRELMLSNLFNSLPAYLVHLPTLVLLLWPALGGPALVYAGLTLAAAALRTAVTVMLARLWLGPGVVHGALSAPAPVTTHGWSARLAAAWQVAWRRFRRRLPRLFGFTIPIYVLIVWLQHAGVFSTLETWLAGQPVWGTWLKPQAVGIVALSLLAEVGASISAAGAVLHSGGLSVQDIVLALLVGNILSTPMRAVRHQFPAYAGYFRPALALRLIVANQSLRAASMVLMAWLYAVCGNW